jgi:hypothetical protein
LADSERWSDSSEEGTSNTLAAEERGVKQEMPLLLSSLAEETDEEAEIATLSPKLLPSEKEDVAVDMWLAVEVRLSAGG